MLRTGSLVFFVHFVKKLSSFTSLNAKNDSNGAFISPILIERLAYVSLLAALLHQSLLTKAEA